MEYLHPLFGGLAATFLLVVGSWGIRSRHRAAYAAPSRQKHRTYAPWAYGAVVSVAVFGTLSAAFLRDDLELADSWHFWLLWATAILLTGSWLTAKRLPGDALARRLHPVLGFVVMALALVGAVLGLGLLP